MGRHLGIAIPSQDTWDAWFGHDLARAMTYHAGTYPDDAIALTIHQSALLGEARNHLCKSSIEEGCEFVVMLDTDMRFPKDVFHRLMQHNQPVVAANCAKRRRPISATARKENPDDRSQLDPVWPDREVTGIERIAVIGAAVMCIRTDVFLQLKYPWFATPWVEDDQRFVGEDLYFCAQLRSHDIPLYVDHDLSWEVRHVGQHSFSMEDVLAEREMARAGLWKHIEPEQALEIAQVMK